MLNQRQPITMQKYLVVYIIIGAQVWEMLKEGVVATLDTGQYDRKREW